MQSTKFTQTQLPDAFIPAIESMPDFENPYNEIKTEILDRWSDIQDEYLKKCRALYSDAKQKGHPIAFVFHGQDEHVLGRMPIQFINLE